MPSIIQAGVEPPYYASLLFAAVPPIGAVAIQFFWYPEASSGSWTSFLVSSAIVVAVTAVICVIVVLVVASRYAFGRGQRLGWSAVGLLLGPAAVLTLVAIRDWPARVVCSGCGKKRVVDREWCEHCDAAFSAPKVDGTEIFSG